MVQKVLGTMTATEVQADVSTRSEGSRGFVINVVASLAATLIAAAASFFAGELDRIGQAFALLAVWTIPFVVGIVVGWWTTRSQGLIATVFAVVLSAASFGAFFVAMPASDVVFEAAAAPRPARADSGDTSTAEAMGSTGRSTALSLEDAVDVQACAWGGNTGYGWEDIAPQFDKQAVTPAGIACTIRDSGAEGHLAFVVPADATSLRTLAGVDSRSKNATANLTFAVLDVDGNVLVEREAGYGQPADITVDVGDLERVQLRVRVADYVNDPDDSPLTAAWGDLRFES